MEFIENLAKSLENDTERTTEEKVEMIENLLRILNEKTFLEAYGRV